MSIFDLPKIDAHCHVLDPVNFPFPDSVPYHPSGQELGSAAYFKQVMKAYGVQHALLVGPNSGYGTDNRCLLDAIAQGQGRFKGIAVLPANVDVVTLQGLKAQGIVGVAFNVALHGLEYYADIAPLLNKLQTLDMWAQFQVRDDQLVDIYPMILDAGVKVLIDHCGRPLLSDGPFATGVQALLQCARDGRSVVKLSGFAKFSRLGYPFEDARTVAMQLWDAFGPEHCLWASDWPYLKADYRLDYGTLLQLAADWFSPDQCQQMMWDNPKKLFQW